MQTRRIRGDYHLLVAQNFLSNISKTGTHEDTVLCIFDTRGLSQSARQGVSRTSSISDNHSVKFHLFQDSQEEIPVTEKDSSLSRVVELPDVLQPISARTLNGEEPYSRSYPAISSYQSSTKKQSFFKRFAKIVSSDDIVGRRDAQLEDDHALRAYSEREPTRKMTTELTPRENDGSERPSSPLSLTQLPFLKRLRTSLGKCERFHLCSDSSFAPLAVISHFPFVSNERRRLRRSRSTVAASTERVRHISQNSVDELRPFDFLKDTEDGVEYSFSHLFSRRRLLSPANATCHRVDRRDSHFLDSSPRRLVGHDGGIVPQLDILVGKDMLSDAELHENREVEWEDGSAGQYDPITFEDVESAGKTVIRTNGFVGITFNFSSADALKTTLNEKFIEKFPRVDLTYSKFKSIKHDLVILAGLCKVDLITTSQAIVYFEKVVLKGLISKSNRKLVAGAAFMVAVKLNDFGKDAIRSIVEHICEHLRISRQDLFCFELPLCAALQFDLLSPPQHIMPHYQRLVLETI